VALALGLGACATAPATAPAPAAEPAAAPLGSAPPTAVAAPAPLDLPAPPWVFGGWSTYLVIAPLTTSLDGLGPLRTESDGDLSTFRSLPMTAIAPELRALVGQELEVLALDAEAPGCRARITAIEAAAWLDPEVDDTSALYPDEGEPLDPQAHAAKVWELGRKMIVARHELMGPDEACARPFLAAPAATFPRPFATRPADAREVALALSLLREHGLWAVQQEAYEDALAMYKRNTRLLVAEGYGVQLPKRTPKSWDAPRADADYTRPEVEVWSDGTGPRYLQARVGNDLTCDAPRIWFVVDLRAGSIVRFGLDIRPELALDVDADGAVELARFDYTTSWIERLEPGAADTAEVVRASGVVDGGQLSCGYEQVPPRSVMMSLRAPAKLD